MGIYCRLWKNRCNIFTVSDTANYQVSDQGYNPDDLQGTAHVECTAVIQSGAHKSLNNCQGPSEMVTIILLQADESKLRVRPAIAGEAGSLKAPPHWTLPDKEWAQPFSNPLPYTLADTQPTSIILPVNGDRE